MTHQRTRLQSWFATVLSLLPLAPLSGQEGAKPPTPPRLLPGMQASGAVLLPNQWSLRPVGKQLELGDFPVNLALHPAGRWLAILHAGASEHELTIVDTQQERIVSRAAIPQTFYGLCFSPDGRQLFASGAEYEVVHQFSFADGFVAQHRTIAVGKPEEKLIPAGLTASADGKTLFVAAPWGNTVCMVSLEQANPVARIPVEHDSYPYTVTLAADGARAFVSLWGRSAVAVLDCAQRKAVAEWPTELHPTEMVLAPDGKALFVACANSTKVSVLDTTSGKGLATIACSLYPSVPKGNTPNSLTMTPDGKLLFVANADANNLAVFEISDPRRAKPLGFIPTGWYPTSVRYNPTNRRLYVANGKGMTSRPNPQGPIPSRAQPRTIEQYIARLLRGTLSIIDLPSPARMAVYSKQAYACSPLRADQGVVTAAPKDSPIPAKPGAPSPIKHCFYIIKENRTYDQVFGDLKEGNGDPNLCLFPETITPNHHRLARTFVLLDNFYVDGEVSADGHEWSMGAYATDFVEKVWPLVYRDGGKKKLSYPAEGSVAIATPAGGYLWDRCAAAKVSYFSFGEWIENGLTPAAPGRARAKALEGHFDPRFRGFDLDYSDQKRADRFVEELHRFEREGTLPQLVILRLPNDHTSGTSLGKPTPRAYLADNDLALGRVVAAITQSPYWKETAIFVVEDDAQNGPDHVDAHRTVAMVISPFAKRGAVDSTPYSTSSMLRTMELILGLEPMSQFDAAARPMYAAFQPQANGAPYSPTVPAVDLNERNRRGAYGTALSATFDFQREDAADDLQLNEVIWRSIKGAAAAMPPPVRAAFVFPHPPRDDD